MQKISGPLMDRIDIHIDVPAVNYKEMRSVADPEGSAQIRERVMRARETQLRRFASSTKHRIYSNAQMTSRHIRTFCELSEDCERLLERAMNQQGLTARAHDRILKVAARLRTSKARRQSNPSTLLKPFSTGHWTGRFGLEIRERRLRSTSLRAGPRHTACRNESSTRVRSLGFQQQPPRVGNQVSNFKRFHQEWDVILLEESADFRLGKAGESEQQVL